MYAGRRFMEKTADIARSTREPWLFSGQRARRALTVVLERGNRHLWSKTDHQTKETLLLAQVEITFLLTISI